MTVGVACFVMIAGLVDTPESLSWYVPLHAFHGMTRGVYGSSSAIIWYPFLYQACGYYVCEASSLLHVPVGFNAAGVLACMSRNNRHWVAVCFLVAPACFTVACEPDLRTSGTQQQAGNKTIALHNGNR